jgi:putative oxidoreductase
MFKQSHRWAPLPLRLVLGIGMMQVGFPKLFVPAGRANIAHLLTELGIPLPEVMGWVVGVVEFFGGLGILVGALMAIAREKYAVDDESTVFD